MTPMLDDSIDTGAAGTEVPTAPLGESAPEVGATAGTVPEPVAAPQSAPEPEPRAASQAEPESAPDAEPVNITDSFADPKSRAVPEPAAPAADAKVEPVADVARTVDLARRVREDCLAVTSRSGAGHIASALSAVDILAVLYGSVMRVNPENPADPLRDRFILSKGHAGSALYSVLAELGYFDRNDFLKSYYANGSSFSGHASHDVPGVELTTGSLGQGLGVACGMALAARLKGETWRVFCVLGDGECDEGNVWESALMASTMCLDRITVVVDRNGMQSFGSTEETALVLGDIADKFRSFGWKTVDCDGHDHRALEAALATPHGGQPLCVVAHTVKGKGVSFMEGDIRWHYDAATPHELGMAFSELAGQGDGFPAGTAVAPKGGDAR